jgi:ABC-2 type transport system ATP-binding protein
MLIKFIDLVKKYDNKTVFNNFFLDICEKQTVALVGNNGCGKTTTIHILCNLIGYDSGEYTFEGKKVTPNYVSFKSKLGIVLSKPYYIEEFDVNEYWKFVAKFQSVPKNEIQKRINDLIQLLDLTNDIKKPIKNLSSGNQMKVSLGAALIHNPPILILDEPFVNLDIATTEKIMNILKGFKGKKTIFITSHQLDLVVDLAERFLIMDIGKIVMELNKSDYPNLEDLKNAVKNLIIKENTTQDLPWLK